METSIQVQMGVFVFLPPIFLQGKMNQQAQDIPGLCALEWTKTCHDSTLFPILGSETHNGEAIAIAVNIAPDDVSIYWVHNYHQVLHRGLKEAPGAVF